MPQPADGQSEFNRHDEVEASMPISKVSTESSYQVRHAGRARRGERGSRQRLCGRPSDEEIDWRAAGVSWQSPDSQPGIAAANHQPTQRRSRILRGSYWHGEGEDAGPETQSESEIGENMNEEEYARFTGQTNEDTSETVKAN